MIQKHRPHPFCLNSCACLLRKTDQIYKFKPQIKCKCWNITKCSVTHISACLEWVCAQSVTVIWNTLRLCLSPSQCPFIESCDQLRVCFSFISDIRVQKQTFLWQRSYTTSCTFSTALTQLFTFCIWQNQVLVHSALVVHQKTNIRNVRIV